MKEWKELKLGELIEIKYGKDHKRLNDGNIPCLGSGGIMRYVDDSLYNGESILIPRKGTLNNVIFQNNPFWTVDTMFWSKIDTRVVFPKFLFYQITLIDFLNLNVGSAVPSLTVPVINDIDIILPPLPEQKAIAQVLSSLDDKIELLNEQNKTLEQMAETLFRQWFVEEAEEDWEEVKLGSLVKVVDNRGKTPPISPIPTQYPLIEVNALTGDNRIIDYTAIRKYVSSSTYESWFRGHPQKYDILISTVGSIGELAMFLEERGTIAQNVISLTSKKVSPFYLYQYLKYLSPYIQELDIGSVQPSIKVPHLLSLNIRIASGQKMNSFDVILRKYTDKIESNIIQIQTLTSLRDTLLPKLMSGEVQVEMN